MSTALRIPADHSAVPFVRFAIVALLAREGWRPEPTCRVMLGASEAVSNAVDHGSAPGGHIDISLWADGRRAELAVRDQGPPGGAGPVVVPAHPPPPHDPHGRGLLILARLSERLELRDLGPGTEVLAGFVERVAAEAARAEGERAA